MPRSLPARASSALAARPRPRGRRVRRPRRGAAAPPTAAGGGGDDRRRSCPTAPSTPSTSQPRAGGGRAVARVWAPSPRTTSTQLAEEFNASQDKVRVLVRNQGVVLRRGAPEVRRRHPEPPAARHRRTWRTPRLRQMVDSGMILPAEACEEADGFSTGQLPAVRNYYTSDGVYWPGYTNVSEPVLYYNVNHFKRAGLDPERPAGDPRRAAGGGRAP